MRYSVVRTESAGKAAPVVGDATPSTPAVGQPQTHETPPVEAPPAEAPAKIDLLGLLASAQKAMSVAGSNYSTAVRETYKRAKDNLSASPVPTPALNADVADKLARANVKREELIRARQAYIDVHARCVQAGCLTDSGQAMRPCTLRADDVGDPDTLLANYRGQGRQATTQSTGGAGNAPGAGVARVKSSRLPGYALVALTLRDMLAPGASQAPVADLQNIARDALTLLLSSEQAGPVLYASLASYVNGLTFPRALTNRAADDRLAAIALAERQVAKMTALAEADADLAPLRDGAQAKLAALQGSPVPAGYVEPESFAWGARPAPQAVAVEPATQDAPPTNLAPEETPETIA